MRTDVKTKVKTLTLTLNAYLSYSSITGVESELEQFVSGIDRSWYRTAPRILSTVCEIKDQAAYLVDLTSDRTKIFGEPIDVLHTELAEITRLCVEIKTLLEKEFSNPVKRALLLITRLVF